MEEKTNKAIKGSKDYQLIIPYKSDKTLGFNHDNADVSWVKKDKRYQISFNLSIEEELIDENQEATNEDSKSKEVKLNFQYDPFAPVVIYNEDNPYFNFKGGGEKGTQLAQTQSPLLKS